MVAAKYVSKVENFFNTLLTKEKCFFFRLSITVVCTSLVLTLVYQGQGCLFFIDKKSILEELVIYHILSLFEKKKNSGKYMEKFFWLSFIQNFVFRRHLVGKFIFLQKYLLAILKKIKSNNLFCFSEQSFQLFWVFIIKI